VEPGRPAGLLKSGTMTELRPDAAGRVGFLHTAQVHVPTFEALSREYLPSTFTVHRVDPEALELARQDGTAESVRAVVAAHLAELRRAGCEVVLCTCSTLGEVAEDLSGDGLEVIRIDRPMLRRAVALGPRVGVLVALTSTVEPTTRVLAEEAADAGATSPWRSALWRGRGMPSWPAMRRPTTQASPGRRIRSQPAPTSSSSPRPAWNPLRPCWPGSPPPC
jgi:hypothetical protein